MREPARAPAGRCKRTSEHARGAACGLPRPAVHIRRSEDRTATHVLLQQQPDITALVAGSDAAALGVYRAATDLGGSARRPVYSCAWARPSSASSLAFELTGVDLRRAEQAQQAAAMLLEILGETAPLRAARSCLQPGWSSGETMAPPTVNQGSKRQCLI